MSSPVRIELDRADRNIARMHAAAEARGVRVRAHVKGHRVVELAQRQVAAGACGIAVMHAAQARPFLRAGITDVVVAHPWTEPWRIQLIAAMARSARVAVHVRTAAALDSYSHAAVAAGVSLDVRIQVGNGGNIGHDQLSETVSLARSVGVRPGLRFSGVTGYQGLDNQSSAATRVQVGRDAAAYLVKVADAVRAAGLTCAEVSASGTPTAAGALESSGITEICTGAYALADAGLAAIGAYTEDDVAITVPDTLPAADRERLLELYPYPWHTPGMYRHVVRGGHGRLLVPHVCAIVTRLTEVTIVDGSRTRVRPVINDADVPST
jgi:D-serine deaminase-like pyridoxal phosphate-dependent protein